MTCEVCDREGCPTLAPGRRFCSRAAEDCAAHAVNWRDLAIAGRTREAALTAEVERLRDERANIDHVAVEADRFVDALMGAWADATPDSADAMDVTRRAMRSHLVRLHDRTAAMERDLATACGELRVNIDEMPPGSTVRRLMLANTAMRRERDAARADAANARQIATEACDGWSAAERAHADTVEGEGYEFDRAGAEKPIAALRASARLARTRRRWRHRVVSCAENTDPPTRQHDSEVPVTIPTDLLARIRAAIADAKDDGHAYAVATRADLAALLALVEAPAPLRPQGDPVTTTDDLIARAQAVLDAAEKMTPGPWKSRGVMIDPAIACIPHRPSMYTLGRTDESTPADDARADADAAGIATLRNDAPAVIRDLLARLADQARGLTVGAAETRLPVAGWAKSRNGDETWWTLILAVGDGAEFYAIVKQYPDRPISWAVAVDPLDEDSAAWAEGTADDPDAAMLRCEDAAAKLIDEARGVLGRRS